MHFQLYLPNEDIYRYTFLRWHVEAFLRCEDRYVRDRLLSVSQRAGLRLSGFYGLPAYEREPGTGPHYRHTSITIEDYRIQGAPPQVLSTQELPGYVIQARDRFALLGPGGSGKTALLLYLFFECLRPESPLQKAGFVPCYVQCDVDDGQSIADLVSQSWEIQLSRWQVKGNLARRPRCLLLFDLRGGSGAGTRILASAARYALEQLSGQPGHRVVVSLRDNGSQMARTARQGFETWLLGAGWGAEKAQQLLGDSLPPELVDRLARLLRTHPELGRIPLLSDLLVELVYFRPEALDRIQRMAELLWMMAARIMDRELEDRWPPKLRALKVWHDDEPAMPYRPHPVDMLLQELAVEMQKNSAGAIPLGRLDRFLSHICARVEEGQVQWWPHDWLDLLRAGEHGEMWGVLTDMPLFRTQEDRLYWLHDSFGQAYFFRCACYDRKWGTCLV